MVEPKAVSSFSSLEHQVELLNLDKIRRFFGRFENSIATLEHLQKHEYRNKRVALVSLIHRSSLVYWPNDKTGVFSNEKFEFLGDSFLNFFVAKQAMITHPNLNEGQLSKLRAAIVGTENLSEKARNLGLGEILLMGKGEAHSDGQKKQNALADAFEAVTASLLIDAGEEKVSAWLLEVFSADLLIGIQTLEQFDAKTRFQQWTQAVVGVPPTYRVVGTTSTPESNEFIVACFLNDVELARSSAKNKRDASKHVAAILQDRVDKGLLTVEELKEKLKGKK